jgi:hypothetical protein
LRLIEWKFGAKFISRASRLHTLRAISCCAARSTAISSDSNHGAGVACALVQGESCPPVENPLRLRTSARAHSEGTDFRPPRNLNVTLYIGAILPFSCTADKHASGSSSKGSRANHVLASKSNRERTRIGAILRSTPIYPQLPPLLPVVLAHLGARQTPHLENRHGHFATSGVKSINQQIEILQAEEGKNARGDWQPSHIWNGDQADRGLEFPHGNPGGARIQFHPLALHVEGAKPLIP